MPVGEGLLLHRQSGTWREQVGFFGAEALPCAAISSLETEYSLPYQSTGIGSWFSGPGPTLLDQTARQIASQKSILADQLFANRRFDRAFVLYRDAYHADPDQARLSYMAGISAWNSGLRNDAVGYLREAAKLEPLQPLTHHALAEWYLEQAEYVEALHHCDQAISLSAHDPHLVVSRASILEASGKRQDAWLQIQQIISSGFRTVKLAALYARLATGTGHESVAIELIQNLLRTPVISAEDTRVLCMAAAALFDRMGRYDDAFRFAQTGQTAELNTYDPAQVEQLVDRQLEFFTPAKLHELPRSSLRSRRPVFIVGMPRSGTSLVEQILASHPQVHGAGELPNVSQIIDRMGRDIEAYPHCLDALSVRSADKHAADYLRAIGKLNSTAKYVVDKMPSNFLNLGLLALLFPDAHVIHCTRNALDTCISCFLTDFAVDRHPARSLSHLGAYYRHYRRLMKHWTSRLNFPMLEVRYEDVVKDAPGQARRLLEFLNLPWDDRCTAFHEARRHVKTASRNQVNRPIYSTSINRWKNYEKYLSPLRAAMGEWADY